MPDQAEPIYTYVKGAGWVIFSERRIQAVTYDGVTIWVIDRKPEIDERFISRRIGRVWDGRTFYNSIFQGPDLETFQSYVSSCYWEDFRFRESDFYDNDYVYVTLVRCDDV